MHLQKRRINFTYVRIILNDSKFGKLGTTNKAKKMPVSKDFWKIQGYM